MFTNPGLTRQMGGYYDTDWKIGSSFGFRKTGGDRLINGILLEFETERLIQHSLYGPDSEAAMAILTYEFLEKDGVTVLTGKEELMHPLDEDAFEDASVGWESALRSLKEIAESAK